MQMHAFRIQPLFLVLAGLSVFAGGVFPDSVFAQATKPSSTPAPQQQEENLGGREVELVKPVIWTLREEYYDLQGGAWNNLFIVRADRLVLRKSPMTRRRGSVLRLDVPFAVTGGGQSAASLGDIEVPAANPTGQGTHAGLGDIYFQAILIPYFSRKFAIGAGSGISFPTATNARLGTGKWVASPIVAPLWRFGKNGFLLVKLQEYVSFAGNNQRPNINYFSTYPIFVWRFRHRWWTQLETESRTNFEKSSQTGFKSGVALGYMITRTKGVWVKPEIGWGKYRPYEFAVKNSVLSVR
ncbi:MAG: hypothetical protein KGL59_11405 [Acidobacteriota bacterium]|nr:hypothetical protein [Acidobacteriota bacterium]